MTTAYTSLLGLALPVDGELTGTWGQTVNNSITSLLDTAIAGTKTADVTSSDWTLTDIDGADAGTARAAVLIPTGTNGATTRSILAPNQSKIYVIINQATGSVDIKGVTGPTTGVTILSGKTSIVAWNGSDFVEITSGGTVTSVAALTLGTTGTNVSSSVLNSTTTPVITLNIPTASASNRGALSSTDWSTFNGKYSTGGALGTPSSGTLSSCTVDGTNAVGYKNIPQTGSDKTTAYELVLTDVGKYVGVGTSGSIVVPTSTFANGDAISIFNNTTGNITITTSAPTAYIAGTNTAKASMTLATRGVATILFVSSTVCVVTGNVS